MRRRAGRCKLQCLLIVSSLALALWATSLVLTITRFGSSVTVTVEDGFIGIYCGGDAQVRNSWVDNGFSAPWKRTGAGRSLPDGMTWAFYGPGTIACPRDWLRAIRDGCFFNSVLGFWMPSIEADNGEVSLILPTWLLALAAGVAVVCSWRRKKPGANTGCCNKCGYNLTANVSGVCPECGERI